MKRLARRCSCLTLEAASYPPSSADFHTYRPKKAFQHFECACDAVVPRVIGVECVHNPRSGQERHINADGVIEERSAPAAVVDFRRRGDGYRFSDK